MSAPHHLSAAWQDADALRTRGQLAAARDLLEPVADVAAIRLGADNPDVIETMRRLATVHRELGELASARRVLEEALEGAQLRLRDDDPVVLGISADLGSIADELGNRHEARRNFTRVARYGPTADHRVALPAVRVGPRGTPPRRSWRPTRKSLGCWRRGRESGGRVVECLQPPVRQIKQMCWKIVSEGGLEPPRPMRALAPQASASAIPPLGPARPLYP